MGGGHCHASAGEPLKSRAGEDLQPAVRAVDADLCARLCCEYKGVAESASEQCGAWVWLDPSGGQSDCDNDEEWPGCCWLKRRGGIGEVVPAAPGQTSVVTGRVEFDDEGIGGWVAVAVIVAAAVCLTLLTAKASRTPPLAILRNLSGLVIDGVRFSTLKSGGAAGVTPSSEKLLPLGSPTSASRGGGSIGLRGAQAVKGIPGALHIAASSGDVSQMQKLAAGMTDPRMSNKWAAMLNAGDSRQYTPFHIACAGGHADCVEFLLDVGCDSTLRNDTGLTGLEIADQLGREGVLKVLQQKGLYQNLKKDSYRSSSRSGSS